MRAGGGGVGGGIGSGDDLDENSSGGSGGGGRQGSVRAAFGALDSVAGLGGGGGGEANVGGGGTFDGRWEREGRRGFTLLLAHQPPPYLETPLLLYTPGSQYRIV